MWRAGFSLSVLVWSSSSSVVCVLCASFVSFVYVCLSSVVRPRRYRVRRVRVVLGRRSALLFVLSIASSGSSHPLTSKSRLMTNCPGIDQNKNTYFVNERTMKQHTISTCLHFDNNPSNWKACQDHLRRKNRNPYIGNPKNAISPTLFLHYIRAIRFSSEH